MSEPPWLPENHGHSVATGIGEGNFFLKSTIVTVPDEEVLYDETRFTQTHIPNGGVHSAPEEHEPSQNRASRADMQQRLEQMWEIQHKEQQMREEQLQRMYRMQQQQAHQEQQNLQYHQQMQQQHLGQQTHHQNGSLDSPSRQSTGQWLRRVLNPTETPRKLNFEETKSGSPSRSVEGAPNLTEDELQGVAAMVRSLVTEKSELLLKLQKSEERVEELHQLLWYSQVAPSHGELTELLLQSIASSYSLSEPEMEKVRNEQVRLQQVVEDLHSQLIANNIQPQYSTEKPESMTNRLLSLEQQLVTYAKIIRKQQMQINDQWVALDAPPPMASASAANIESTEQTGETVEQLRARISQKDGMLVQMDHALVMREMEVDALQQSLATRDMVLSQRQAEISVKEEEMRTLKASLEWRERENTFLKNAFTSSGLPLPPLPPDLHDPQTHSVQLLGQSRQLLSTRTQRIHSIPPPAAAAAQLQPSSPSISASHDPSTPNAPSEAGSGTTAAIGAWDSARAEVQEQLTRMTRTRMSLYSPRPSSQPLSYLNPPSGSRKLAKLRASMVGGEGGEASENAIVTL